MNLLRIRVALAAGAMTLAAAAGAVTVGQASPATPSMGHVQAGAAATSVTAARVTSASAPVAQTGRASASSPASASVPARLTAVKQPSVAHLDCRGAATYIASQPGGAYKNSPPVDFTGRTIDCHDLNLNNYIAGHPAFINFYATWCHPCNDEAPGLAAFYEKHQQDGLRGVAVLADDPTGDPGYFYTKLGYSFPTVWDDGVNDALSPVTGGDSGSQVLTAYMGTGRHIVHTLPTMIWVRPNGTVYLYTAGSETPDKLELHYRCSLDLSAVPTDPSCIPDGIPSPAGIW